jgi:CubicO group peptidase (beta-lactamase class C family)
MLQAPRGPIVLACLLAACGPSAGAQTPIAQFEKRLEELRTQSSIPALTAGIAKGQQIVWSKSFGIADLATGRPATDTTVYHLASITKPIASAVTGVTPSRVSSSR